MKASELRDMTEEELIRKQEELKRELFNLNFQKVTGELVNCRTISSVKRDIARVLTVMREKENGS
jgi:large subunit ribosomal protein L29